MHDAIQNPESRIQNEPHAEPAEAAEKSGRTFYGRTYMYPTPNNGLCKIGVTGGLGDSWIVAWIKPNGSTSRVKTPNLPAGTDPLELQIKLDAYAKARSLRDCPSPISNASSQEQTEVTEAHTGQLRQLRIDLGKDLGSRFPEGGIMAIAAERARQIRLGFDAKRDAQHPDDRLAMCAGLICRREYDADLRADEWENETAEHVLQKYSDDRIKQLAIAGALIAAEIDRLSRSSGGAA